MSYISTNPKVAKVDNTSGKVTGVKKGKCNLLKKNLFTHVSVVFSTDR